MPLGSSSAAPVMRPGRAGSRDLAGSRRRSARSPFAVAGWTARRRPVAGFACSRRRTSPPFPHRSPLLRGRSGAPAGFLPSPRVRKRWIACTTTEPSPTPEATRLTEPERTSPTAKMPRARSRTANRRRRPRCARCGRTLARRARGSRRPVGVRLGADHHEDVADRRASRSRRSRGSIQVTLAQALVARERGDLGARCGA